MTDSQSSENAIDRFFGIGEAGSTVRREVVGGLTTFATMSYIIFVQPTVLSAAGMPFGSVLLATCFSAAFASILMGFLARYPFAQAPGMGQNFLFAFTVCAPVGMGGMGFSWQAGLFIVLCSGIIFLTLSFFQFREKVVDVLPACLKHSIGPGIGLFIAFVGLQWGGIIVHSPSTMVQMGSFHTGPALLTTGGTLLIVALLARGIRGAILIGILGTAGVGVATGVVPYSYEPFEFSVETFFRLSPSEALASWPNALLAIGLFFFLDLFDTVGTLVGVGAQGGFLDEEGRLKRANQAFISDASGSCFGALCGTSTVTTYVESATGIAAGARTGLAAVVTGLSFLAAIVLAPVVRIVGEDVGPAFYGEEAGVQISMYPAVAPALITVGCLMMTPLRKVNWDDYTESFPAFLTVVGMVLGYGITEGIALGCISYVLIKGLSGQWRDVHPILAIIALALILRYAFLMA